MKNHLILGDWNALCDSCGRKFKASSLKKRWDGLIVCREDWEQRHPQDLLRVQREQISVPWSRPYPAQDTFIPVNYTDFENDYLGFNEVVAIGFQRPVSESMALAETTALLTNKSATDTLSISESQTYTLVSQTAINGSALNTYTLG